MTDLERLIELLKPYMNAESCEHESGSCELANCRECRARDIADHLIENGVILLPCKIGDEVYRISKRYGKWVVLPRNVVCVTYSINYRNEIIWQLFTTTIDVLDVTVFLTREEAEEAIRRRKETNTT